MLYPIDPSHWFSFVFKNNEGIYVKVLPDSKLSTTSLTNDYILPMVRKEIIGRIFCYEVCENVMSKFFLFSVHLTAISGMVVTIIMVIIAEIGT